VVRYNTDGSLDTDFNGTGIVTTTISNGSDRGHGIAIQPDGKILVAGPTYPFTNSTFALARYTITGSLDTTFNGTGIVTTPIGSNDDYAHSMALQPNGKIVVAGFQYTVPVVDETFAVVRYNSDGSLDATFNSTGIITTAINNRALGFSAAIQPDGNIVVAGASGTGGDFDFAVVRYLGDTPSSGTDTPVYLPIVLKDS
jgi:uncharacterized delta-60 repeat protein